MLELPGSLACSWHEELKASLNIRSYTILMQVLDRTMRVDYVFPRKPLVSEACKDFIARLLVADPDKRLSIQEIYRHPWFSTGFPPQVRDMALQASPAHYIDEQCRNPSIPGLSSGLYRMH